MEPKQLQLEIGGNFNILSLLLLLLFQNLLAIMHNLNKQIKQKTKKQQLWCIWK